MLISNMSNILKFPNFVFGYKNILKTENKLKKDNEQALK